MYLWPIKRSILPCWSFQIIFANSSILIKVMYNAIYFNCSNIRGNFINSIGVNVVFLAFVIYRCNTKCFCFNSALYIAYRSNLYRSFNSIQATFVSIIIFLLLMHMCSHQGKKGKKVLIFIQYLLNVFIRVLTKTSTRLCTGLSFSFILSFLAVKAALY